VAAMHAVEVPDRQRDGLVGRLRQPPIDAHVESGRDARKRTLAALSKSLNISRKPAFAGLPRGLSGARSRESPTMQHANTHKATKYTHT
jgi:hypothetical protein